MKGRRRRSGRQGLWGLCLLLLAPIGAQELFLDERLGLHLHSETGADVLIDGVNVRLELEALQARPWLATLPAYTTFDVDNAVMHGQRTFRHPQRLPLSPALRSGEAALILAGTFEARGPASTTRVFVECYANDTYITSTMVSRAAASQARLLSLSAHEVVLNTTSQYNRRFWFNGINSSIAIGFYLHGPDQLPLIVTGVLAAVSNDDNPSQLRLDFAMPVTALEVLQAALQASPPSSLLVLLHHTSGSDLSPIIYEFSGNQTVGPRALTASVSGLAWPDERNNAFRVGTTHIRVGFLFNAPGSVLAVTDAVTRLSDFTSTALSVSSTVEAIPPARSDSNVPDGAEDEAQLLQQLKQQRRETRRRLRQELAARHDPPAVPPTTASASANVTTAAQEQDVVGSPEPASELPARVADSSHTERPTRRRRETRRSEVQARRQERLAQRTLETPSTALSSTVPGVPAALLPRGPSPTRATTSTAPIAETASQRPATSPPRVKSARRISRRQTSRRRRRFHDDASDTASSVGHDDENRAAGLGHHEHSFEERPPSEISFGSHHSLPVADIPRPKSAGGHLLRRQLEDVEASAAIVSWWDAQGFVSRTIHVTDEPQPTEAAEHVMIPMDEPLLRLHAATPAPAPDNVPKVTKLFAVQRHAKRAPLMPPELPDHAPALQQQRAQEDGLYVARPMTLPADTSSAWRQRIAQLATLQSDNPERPDNSVLAKWLDVDGYVLTAVNPLRDTRTRAPFVLDRLDLLQLEVDRRLAQAETLDNSYLAEEEGAGSRDDDDDDEPDLIYVEASPVGNLLGSPEGHEPLAGPDAVIQIGVYLSGVRFLSHPAFNDEQAIAARLEALVQQYVDMDVDHEVSVLEDSLHQQAQRAAHELRRYELLTGSAVPGLTAADMAVRHRVVVVGDHDLLATTLGANGTMLVPDAEQAPAEVARLALERLTGILREWALLVEARDDLLRRESHVVRGILLCWQQIKALRRQQGFVSSPLLLKVQKVPCVAEEDQRSQDQEVAERLDLEYLKFACEIILDYFQQAAMDPELEPPRVHPEDGRLAFFAQSAAKQRLEAMINRHRRPPGQARLIPHLSAHGDVTPLKDCPNTERRRRQRAQAIKYHLALFINDKQVFKSNDVRLDENDFSLPCREYVTCRLRAAPRNLAVKVLEASRSGEIELATVFLPVPSPGQAVDEGRTSWVTFSSEQRSRPGLRLTNAEEDELRLDLGGDDLEFLTGQICYAVGWARSPHDGLLMGPRAAALDMDQQLHALRELQTLAGLGFAGLPTGELRSRWLHQAALDPLDPMNQKLLAAVGAMHAKPSTTEYFRLGAPDDITFDALVSPRAEAVANSPRLVDQGDLALANARHKFLLLRAQNEDALVGKPCPLTEPEIPVQQLEHIDDLRRHGLVEQRAETDGTSVLSRAVNEAYSYLRGEQGHELMALLLERARRLNQLAMAPRLSDIVDDTYLPISVSINFFQSPLMRRVLSWFQPHRPLRPHREQQRHAAPLTQSKVNICLRVGQLARIPLRVSGSSSNAGDVGRRGRNRTRRGLDGSNGTSNDMRPATAQTSLSVVDVLKKLDTVANCVIVATLQGQSVSTSVSVGANATFNEELVLPFTMAQGAISAESLRSCLDEVSLTLYDEKRVPNSDQSTPSHGAEVMVHVRRQFLGTLTIPVAVLFELTQMEGIFAFDTPLALHGHQRHAAMASDGAGAHQVGAIPSVSETGLQLPLQPQAGQWDTTLAHTAPAITLFASLSPPLKTPEAVALRCESEEPTDLLAAARELAHEMQGSFNDRVVQTCTIDLAGLESLPCWLIFLRLDIGAFAAEPELVRLRRLARVVAALAPARHNFSRQRLRVDMTATSDQVFRLGEATNLEKAILFCNYVLHQSTVQEAFVVVCAHPLQGRTAAVLTKAQEEYFLWDVTVGEHVAVGDPNCLFRAIGTMFSEQNLWINIQSTTKPSTMGFNVTDRQHWRPLFDEAPRLTTMQLSVLPYADADPLALQTLHETLLDALRQEIEGWRGSQITRWNRHLSQCLHRSLSVFEEARVQGVCLRGDEQPELQEIVSAYAFAGVPYCCSLTSRTALTQLARASLIWDTHDRNAEFGLAVHLVPYVRNAVVGWIYFARVAPPS
ncbi:uncharacterized protein MONBRDRAFT_25895 [Monosiga brevicollis MX1]|uniref:C2 domain-containing protein n=1 Tax=Monosiga brevicollis TaxID=81824 RepID=A9V0S7_MONBE|nr:uncharacterized protein MONBRDRAFT_25895 [Monosiga brevicollis MX1]EDQ88688.1 predicted protein [Monosiga brevicollis MX1]|eukprot:XP_001746301.1 hypothetical protein [Monosiga brevicollis MX1]